ncbi:MAG: class I SAM-dependent methyltransferase [Patescibacteria group bacterium]
MDNFIISNEYWNTGETVEYFGTKPPDPRIVKRAKALLLANPGIALRALDLGCGGGRHTRMLRDLGFDVDACDVNPAMLEATRSIAPELAGQVVEASILSLPYADRTFDMIVSTGVLHQVYSIEEYGRATKEIARVMKPGAIFCMNVFTSKTIDSRLQKMRTDEPVYLTNEGLPMTLLSSTEVCELLERQGIRLEGKPEESDKQEPTGIRTVFRAIFKRD